MIRNRGVRVFVDTTETAELDIALFRVPPDIVEAIARNLSDLPVSPRDRHAGNVRIRELSGFDVAFVLTRDNASLVVTIAVLRPPDPDDPLEENLKRLGLLDMIRGASGM
ncbi:hypothetical protein [Aestuariicoccus sp. MJ-SS9]|uniref:hypothetical protein n=1 Tax=Aestuariicoccus sp. MJ-SS9 TaxID=3079855 RepID=UPI00290FBDC2|nr:hypothetical protein [Aestuariicoccus sp. MJ-SS9]MDU8910586.1 hypothetical protein [Aestuariicoccus sp. MJ-SS9]